MVQSISTILGGLAIFIFGMQLMSDGLQKVAGQRMRSILHLFAKNRFVAITTGAVVTSVIQSSCATTVMVVGFVNAGLLTLQQSIGIICGSHIGTTITGQLVAFKISWIIMPSIVIGLLMNFIKHRATANWGTTVMGFGFLFMGMEFMSKELKELSHTDAVTRIFQTFCCEPVNGSIPLGAFIGAVVIGIVVTFVIQSSSACSGIVIVLAGSGLLDLYTSSAIVLGSNIGTTITALIAAIPANRVAKQAALSHTLTATIGVLLVVVTIHITVGGIPAFFKLVDICSPGAGLQRKIANANTLFNIVSTLIFVPFIPLITRLCETIIPVQRKDVRFERLEPHLLATPSIALAQTTAALRKMLKKAWTTVDCALNLYNRNDEKNQRILKQLDKREQEVDEFQRNIADYLSKLMLRPLTAEQTRQIPMLLHCSNDAERIGDHTSIIRSIIERMQQEKLSFSPKAAEEFNDLHDNLADLTDAVVAVLEKKTEENFKTARNMYRMINLKLSTSEGEHIKRISSGLCVPQVGIIFLDLLDEIRKIAHHLSNITDRADNFYEKLAKLGKIMDADTTMDSDNTMDYVTQDTPLSPAR